MQYPNSRILIFAKAPQAGQVKTRLIPALGAAGAARFYAGLLESTVRMAVSSGLAPVQCWCAPDTDDSYLRGLARKFDVVLETQQGADLGARMERAASRVLKEAQSIVLVGGDCPVMDAAYLGRALAWLQEDNEVVLGPAEDGGYVLIGLTNVSPELFRGIQWGGEQVLELTRQRLLRLGWRWRELETLWDLDRPADLDRFRSLDSVSVAGWSALSGVRQLS